MKTMTSLLLTLIFLSTSSKAHPLQEANLVEEDSLIGSGNFIFTPQAPLDQMPLKVWYYVPYKNKNEAPVLILMHGNSRNAQGYWKNMMEYAERYGFVLVVPEFSKDHFPKSRHYHQGNIFDQENKLLPPEQRSFSLIEPLFDHIKQRTGNTSVGYNLYGFSAGAQFVHRFMMLQSDNRAVRIISASPGYYTLPDPKINYPYGLKGTDVTQEAMEAFFQSDFTVMVGAADTVLSRQDLIKSSLANNQGKDRVERAMNFFIQAKTKARALDVPFNWKFELVTDVGHSNGQIAEAVARHFFHTGSPRGGLLIQGGGVLDEELEQEILLKEFKALSVKKNPRLLIIPYAARPERVAASAKRYVDIFTKLGYGNIRVLDLKDPTKARQEIEQSDMIWMPGGSQTLLKVRLEEAGLVELLQKRNKAGVPIGGTSAGAAIMSGTMLSGNKTMNNTDHMLPVMYQGLDLWPEAIVDQHFNERDRMERLEIAVRNHPGLVGVGIDENTAVVVKPGSFKVVGANSVTVVRIVPKGGKKSQMEKTVLVSGDVYHFRN